MVGLAYNRGTVNHPLPESRRRPMTTTAAPSAPPPQRILVTGGAGFIGSHVVDQLLALPQVEQVTVLDDLSRGTLGNLAGAQADHRFRLVQGDILDTDLLNRELAAHEACLHLAAIRITQCAQEPQAAFDVMLRATFDVLQGCVAHGVRKLVFASSASVYGEADHFPTAEDHPPYNNRTLYGATKLAGEAMCRAYADRYALNYTAFRFFNVYGARMDRVGKYTEVLIRWFDRIQAGERPLIYGDGSQTMDFVYVEDVAKAVVVGLHTDRTDEVYNVGRGLEISLLELCQALLKVMGSDLEPECLPLPEERRNVEVGRRKADIRKAQEHLGYTAGITLEEGLARLVAWLHTQNTAQLACL
jgi:UDP-glucose 4-epimerase